MSKITLGFIIPFAGKRRSAARVVKITKESSNCVLVKATQKGSFQEFRFYSSDVQASMLALARFVRDNKWELRFRRQADDES